MIKRFLIVLLLIAAVLTAGCNTEHNDEITDADERTDHEVPATVNYRQAMRTFVHDISTYARLSDSNFIVIPQNSHELLTETGEPFGPLSTAYIEAIDGIGREDLFYGYDKDNVPTPEVERDAMIAFMDLAEANDVKVLVTDYCWTSSFIDDSYEQNAARGYISFAADHRALDTIPAYPAEPYNVHSNDVTSLKEARNFLYLINPGAFPDKAAFLDAIRETDYDVVLVDLFYDEDTALTQSEVESLKRKDNGGKRLVIAYMSIGEAEEYRYYWQADWETEPPEWLAAENPEWQGNYKVLYWDPEWQAIIYGDEHAYLVGYSKRALTAFTST